VEVSVEVVDCAFGRPAEGVAVRLLREVDGGWRPVGATKTDGDGLAFLRGDTAARGRYRLVLDLDRYFSGLGVAPLQSCVELVFRVFSPEEPVPFVVMVTPSSSSVYRVAPSHRGSGDPAAT
jgi:5-hydroxyisourate hydrolase